MKKSIMVMVVALVSVALVGCGGAGLDLWKVSVYEKGESCTISGTNPPPPTTTERTAETWEIYKGPDSKYYLHVEERMYEGTKDGGKYKFTGVDKRYNPWAAETNVTVTTTVTYELEIKGSSFTGTYVSEVVRSCQGRDCSNTDRTHTGTCTTTADYVGVKVSPDFEHQI